jgi:hypothetical protein
MQLNFLQRAEAEVQRLTGAWRGCPPIKVVRAAADLPFEAYEDVRGVYVIKTGQTYIVAAPQYAADVGEVLAHEVIAHHGLRAGKGGTWRSFMLSIQAGLRGGDSMLRGCREYLAPIYVDDRGQFNLNAVQEADEIAALIAEARFNDASGRLKIDKPFSKQWLAVRRHVARESLYLDRPVTFEELEGAILASERRLRHGDGLFGIGWRLRRWYAPPMSFDPYKPPMSIAESERLLKAEAYRIKSKEDSKTGWSMLVGMSALFVLLPLCLFGMVFGLFSALFR